ncbi:MAG: TAT-variant-translocated molybdopterin oxidoreductase [Pirellulales bacterium]
MSVAESSTKVGKNDYWRSLSELEGTPEFEQYLQREFPQAASEFPEGVSRRRWLKLMSASLALGAAAGCRYGPDKIAAFVNRPANTVPGIPKYIATNIELAGRAVHALVTSYDGRPIKVDGNAEHPLMKGSEPNNIAKEGKSRFASAGSDLYTQACILGLYDPDRLDKVVRRVDGKAVDSNWEGFDKFAAERFESLKASSGKSLAILTAPTLSPTVQRLIADLVKALPETTVAVYSSVDNTAQEAAASQLAGAPAELLYNLEAAKVIVALDDDLLGSHANSVLYSRQFAKGRTPVLDKMNRLYSVESRYTVTGSSADSRLPLRSSQIEYFVAKLEKKVVELKGGVAPKAAAEGEKPFDEIPTAEQAERTLDAIAEDLVKNAGKSLVTVGAHQPLNVQLAVLRINKLLGSIGVTVSLMPSRTAIASVKTVGLAEFTERVSGGGIDTVWVLGDNPVYTAPADVDLAKTLKSVAHSVYFTEYVDETADVTGWNVPTAHALESWSDVRGVDGSYGIGQPQIDPLLNGRSKAELLSVLSGQPGAVGLELVKTTAALVSPGLSVRTWSEALHNGYVAGVTSAPLGSAGNIDAPINDAEFDFGPSENGKLEVLLYNSDTLFDGRFANNVWLQELPQPTTKLVWDNAALVSPETAEALGLKQGARMGELCRLVVGKATIEIPVFIVPGQANGAISLALGYGRKCSGLGDGDTAVVGHSVRALRGLKTLSIVTGVEARPTSIPYKLATTQDHFAIDALGLGETAKRSIQLIREGTLEQVDAEYVKHLGTHHPDLFSLWEEPIDIEEKDPTVLHQWAMTVDLNKCTGCSACVVACQSENNVPVVGKEQVSRGREMHWLRIDRYFTGDRNAPKIVNQPVACMHCETAPCEQVCPVAATVHTEEGINAMAYNRCIGTRYCANNCPYKVRRFNYFNYNTEYGYFYGWQDWREQANRKLQQLVLNPEVSVRGRGVMEKCTYCIQRVQYGKINARNEGRPLQDGEIKTACQEACPTQAIIFGDQKDPSSWVARLQKDPRNYSMLEELNVKPRTQYLARVRNVHQRLKTTEQLVHHAGEESSSSHH